MNFFDATTSSQLALIHIMTGNMWKLANLALSKTTACVFYT